MDERFSFLELPGSSAPSYRLPETPDNQYLNYLDLVALRPTPASLKRVTRKLMNKYSFIPIVSHPAHFQLRLPARLDPVYHIQYKMGKGQVCYLALVPPQQELPLQLIYNALGQGIYGIPIRLETYARFMEEKYASLKA